MQSGTIGFVADEFLEQLRLYVDDPEHPISKEENRPELADIACGDVKALGG
jgi:hypothetical protein